jgi:hypothetical protein
MSAEREQWPAELYRLRQSGIRRLIMEEVEEARKQAELASREGYLGVLEAYQVELGDQVPPGLSAWLDANIRYLRRCLHVSPTLEQVRVQTRERTRRWRERKRAGKIGPALADRS